MAKTQKELQTQIEKWAHDPKVGAGIQYMEMNATVPLGAVRFYEPGKMRWFELNGSTQQHLYTATYTSMEAAGCGIWLIDGDNKFAYVTPWAECADAIMTPEDKIMEYYRTAATYMANPKNAADFEEFIKYG
jgi:hypothetical protein